MLSYKLSLISLAHSPTESYHTSGFWTAVKISRILFSRQIQLCAVFLTRRGEVISFVKNILKLYCNNFTLRQCTPLVEFSDH